MSKKFLHIASCDNFIPPFIQLVSANFSNDQHEFLLTGGMAETTLIKSQNVHLADATPKGKIRHYLSCLVKMHQADKVILHGLFNFKIVCMLFFMPWLLKKCYWIMWGGDLYVYKLGLRNWKWKIKELFRRPVIKNMGNLVTYIEGDADLARQWYGAKGEYQECLMYLSNVYKEYELPNKEGSTINIQVGNSADPSNNHFEVFEKLIPYKDDDILIHVPLSYGDKVYGKKVSAKGVELFGDKFKAITEVMPFNQYLEFLGGIDIAVFNHKRQQAMGNTITLLGLGKTVYIRDETTQWSFFKNKKIILNNIETLEINTISEYQKKSNINHIKEYFSKENYLNQLSRLF